MIKRFWRWLFPPRLWAIAFDGSRYLPSPWFFPLCGMRCSRCGKTLQEHIEAR